MKPVLILQHQHADGPSFLATWLHEQGVGFEVRNTEAGEEFPTAIEEFAGLAVLGGAMGANDDLESLRCAERLILDAMRTQRPVLGHCLGGQLMARALGAEVTGSPAAEIGWQPMDVFDVSAARDWLGEPGTRTVFHWHHDAFALPAGAQRLAGSGACPNQAFAVGPHLAMQFHVEIDHEKLVRWSHDRDERFLASLHLPSVQEGAAMRAGAVRWLAPQQALARRIYRRWVEAMPL